MNSSLPAKRVSRSSWKTAQHEIRPLVGGEAPGEPDCESVEAQRMAHLIDELERLTARFRAVGGTAAGGIDQLGLQRLARFP
jgi:hypothetical protein